MFERGGGMGRGCLQAYMIANETLDLRRNVGELVDHDETLPCGIRSMSTWMMHIANMKVGENISDRKQRAR